jgi:DDE_Tnp_1-associated
MDFDVAEEFSKSRLKSLLDHLGRVDDVREPWRVAHPLREVLFLVVCGTICDCEDYDSIADWGESIWISCAVSRPSITALRADAG